MRKICLLLMAGCLAVCGMTLSDFGIEYGSFATAAEKNAAAELSNHLTASLGRKIPAAVENGSGKQTVIYVGNTAFARKNAVFTDKMESQSFVIRQCGRHLLIAGGGSQGTLYGALDFLERFVGIDWLDEWIRYIPRHQSIEIPDGLNFTDRPVFATRGIYVNRCTALENRIQFRSRCRDNIFWEESMPDHVIQRWGISPVYGSPGMIHTLHYYTQSWPKSMDDCFSLSQDGLRIRSRNSSGPGQICFSNPRARAKIAEQLLAYIAADRKKNPVHYPRLYSLTLNDASDRCHCPECLAREKKYQAYSGVVLEYTNAVAARVAGVYPDVKLVFAPYLFTEKPPVGIRAADNVVIDITLSPWSEYRLQTMFPLKHPENRNALESLKTWSGLGKNIHIWNYWIVYDACPSANTGMVNMETVHENLKYLQKHHAKLIFSECERPDIVSFHSLRVFLGYKLKWNPNQPVEPLLQRFFRGYYLAGADAMREFYDYMVRRQKEASLLNTPDASARRYLDAAFFKKAEDCFARAEQAIGNNAPYRFNVMRERVCMDLARLVCRNVAEEAGLPSRKMVAERLKKNWPVSIDRYFVGRDWSDGPRDVMKRFLEKIARPSMAPGLKYPVPGMQLEGREVFDITWKDFNSLKEMQNYGIHLADDPEATGGRAMCMTRPLRGDTEKVYHSTPYRCGIYRDGKDVMNKYFDRPADEKYHLLHFGQVELSPSTLFWMHNSWTLQHHLDPVYRPGKNNVYDIYFSVKRQGPAYFPKSQKKNAILIDRILLIAPK